VRCNTARGAILAACLLLGADKAGAAPLAAYADFQHMSNSELATCQVKLTHGFELGSLPPPSYILATSVAAVDVPAFYPFERRNRFSYVSDHILTKNSEPTNLKYPSVVVVTPAELHAIFAAVAPLAGVVDGGVDSSAEMSFAVLQKRGAAPRCFESQLDSTNAMQLVVAIKRALLADAKAYDGVAEFACGLRWQGEEPASLLSASEAEITVSDLRRSGSKGEWRFDGAVSVRNVSPATLAPPLFVVLACKGPLATLTGGSGSTCGIWPFGTPYLLLPVGRGLKPGRSITVPVAFSNALDDGIELTYIAPGGVAIAPRVFQGAGER
jgi:hypothetical protein